MTVKSWEPQGQPEELAARYGKRFLMQKYRAPHGAQVDFALFGCKDWSIVLPITDDDQVVTIHEYKHGVNQVVHCLPAGMADKDAENRAELARRELLEETGYQARELIHLGSVSLTDRHSWTFGHCFLAIGCNKVADLKLDPEEEIEVELIPLNEWIEIVQSGRVITNSVADVTFRALPHLGYRITR